MTVKEKILQDSNLDPRVWDITDNGDFIKRQIPITDQSKEADESGEKFSSFLHALVRGLPAAAAGTATTAGLAGLSMTGVGIPIAGGIAAAMGTSYLTDKAIEGISPDTAANLARLREKNPISSGIGDIASMVGGGLRPAPFRFYSGVKGMGKVARDVTKGVLAKDSIPRVGTASSTLRQRAGKALTDSVKSLSQAERQNMMEAGLGSGLGVGMRAGSDYAMGRDQSPGALLSEAFFGGMMMGKERLNPIPGARHENGPVNPAPRQLTAGPNHEGIMRVQQLNDQAKLLAHGVIPRRESGARAGETAEEALLRNAKELDNIHTDKSHAELLEDALPEMMGGKYSTLETIKLDSDNGRLYSGPDESAASRTAGLYPQTEVQPPKFSPKSSVPNTDKTIDVEATVLPKSLEETSHEATLARERRRKEGNEQLTIMREQHAKAEELIAQNKIQQNILTEQRLIKEAKELTEAKAKIKRFQTTKRNVKKRLKDNNVETEQRAIQTKFVQDVKALDDLEGLKPADGIPYSKQISDIDVSMPFKEFQKRRVRPILKALEKDVTALNARLRKNAKARQHRELTKKLELQAASERASVDQPKGMFFTADKRSGAHQKYIDAIARIPKEDAANYMASLTAKELHDVSVAFGVDVPRNAYVKTVEASKVLHKGTEYIQKTPYEVAIANLRRGLNSPEPIPTQTAGKVLTKPNRGRSSISAEREPRSEFIIPLPKKGAKIPKAANLSKKAPAISMKPKGMQIKINPRAGEAGFVDFKTVQELYIVGRDIIVSGYNSLRRFTQELMRRIGPKGLSQSPNIKDYIKTVWDALKARVHNFPKPSLKRLLKPRVNPQDTTKAYENLSNPVTPNAAKAAQPTTSRRTPFNLFGLIESATESMARRDSQTHRYLAPIFNKFFELQRNYVGKYVDYPKLQISKLLRRNALENFRNNSSSESKLLHFLEQLDDIPVNKDQPPLSFAGQIAYAKANDIFDLHGNSLGRLNDNEIEAFKIIRQNFLDVREKQIALGIPVKDGGKFRTAQSNPTYLPHIMSKEVMNILKTGDTTTEAFQDIREAFINWHVAHSKSLSADKRGIAEASFDKLRESFTSSTNVKLGEQFGPVDKAAGIGLPPSMRSRELFDVLDRYNARVARRFAYASTIGADDRAMWAIGRKFKNEKDSENAPLADSLQGTQDGGKQRLKKQYFDLEGSEPVQIIERDENVQAIMRAIDGTFDQTSRGWEAFNRLVKSAIMGPYTGVRDVATGQILTMAYAGSPLQFLRAKAYAWGITNTSLAEGMRGKFLQNIKDRFAEGIEGSTRTGVNTFSIGQLESINFQEDIAFDILKNAADFLNKAQGRQMFERLARSNAFNEGMFLIQDNFAAALKYGLDKNGYINMPGLKFGGINGAKSRTQFLDNFMPSWRKELYNSQLDRKNGKVTDVLDSIYDDAAARFVEDVQGTYDLRNLPKITQEGPSSSFLSLSRWSIEKSNNFNKRVVNPLFNEGNFMPLAMAVGGAVFGGAAIAKMGEDITGRKVKAPNVAELRAKVRKDGLDVFGNGAIGDDMFYKLASVVQASGYGGVMGDAVMQTVTSLEGDSSLGLFQSPLAEAIRSNTSLFLNALEALADGEMDMGINIMAEFTAANLQSFRLVRNAIMQDRQDTIQSANRYRDLNVFRRLEGKDVESGNMKHNPFEHKARKRFKRTGDIQEAIPLSKRLVQDEIANSKGNPERLRQGLDSLRHISDSSTPSMTSAPLEFQQYAQFLDSTQGSNAGNQMMLRAAKQQAINKLKKNLIPSF